MSCQGNESWKLNYPIGQYLRRFDNVTKPKSARLHTVNFNARTLYVHDMYGYDSLSRS